MSHTVITNKEYFQHFPKLSTGHFSGINCVLFGKNFKVRADETLRHVHVKVTDRCNARCGFCIEKDSNITENPKLLLHNLQKLLNELQQQNLLYSVSITGGEPYIYKHLQQVFDLITNYDVFFTLNTNGRKVVPMVNSPEWLNISKHDFDDSSIFHLNALTKTDLLKIKKATSSKIRIQSVLLPGHLDTVDKIIKFINKYKSAVDDFSFRQRMTTESAKAEVTLNPLRKELLKSGLLVEQVIEDYYVYETWYLDGVNITTSFADMQLLEKAEKNESKKLLREIIVHPDGMVTGDWARKRKIITC